MKFAGVVRLCAVRTVAHSGLTTEPRTGPYPRLGIRQLPNQLPGLRGIEQALLQNVLLREGLRHDWYRLYVDPSTLDLCICSRAMAKKKTAAQKKVSKVMREYGKGELHSGSKKGPVVKSRKQAIAIAMSEAGMTKKPTKKGKK